MEAQPIFDAPTLLRVENLTVDYTSKFSAPARAIENVSFTLREGEALGVVGESGCGKTTLMLAILRLLPPTARIVRGKALFLGHDLFQLTEKELDDRRWKDISIIFQGAMNALNPVHTVGKQISEAITLHMPPAPKLDVDRRVAELLDLVGIGPERARQYPHQYSGGMRQRAMIAMALACNPSVIIADEPTTALDVMVQAQILELLGELRKKLGLAVILVTHDLGVVAELCDSVLVMYGGIAAEYSAADRIFNLPAHPYTQELLKAFPDLSRPTDRLVSIPGSPPRLNDLPPGCRFAPRCPAAFDRCIIEAPPAHLVSEGHYAACHLVEPGGGPRR